MRGNPIPRIDVNKGIVVDCCCYCTFFLAKCIYIILSTLSKHTFKTGCTRCRNIFVEVAVFKRSCFCVLRKLTGCLPFSDPVKSAPLTIIRKSPLKHGKNRLSNSGSGGSRESSPQSNPKLDDVLLKTMNASAGEGKPVLPDQPAKLVSVDQPALPDLSAKSALNQLANPAFQDPLEKPALLNPPAKPDLPDQRAKPALPNSLANPALPNQIANPVSSNPQARSALPDHPAIPALPAKPALPTKPPLPTKPALPEKPVLPAKPVLQGPLSTAQLHQTQTSEKPLMAEGNSSSLGQRNSVALPEVDVVDAKQRTVTVDTALPVPSQGTSRGFLEQKRMKKQHKVQGNTTTSDKPKRTFSLKARRTNTVEKPKLVKCDSVDSTNARIEVSRNCAESTVDELTEFKAHAGFEKWKREKSGSLGPGKLRTSTSEFSSEFLTKLFSSLNNQYCHYRIDQSGHCLNNRCHQLH